MDHIIVLGCSSLINRGIICRHYFQVLHNPAKFHIRIIPSRWYYKDKDPSREPFLVANKFETETAPDEAVQPRLIK